MSQPGEFDSGMEFPVPETAARPPRHGFQGDRGARPPAREVPQGLTMAVSRETGARGGSIARLAGSKLGWQVYDQELLEYMTQDGVVRQSVTDSLSPAAARWVDGRMAELRRTGRVHDDPAIANLARVILALAAQGQVVLVGRGAGCILPPETTLHVRIVAPLEERIAYLGQRLRLARKEATERLRARDDQRSAFIAHYFARSASDMHQYDLVLNSSHVGEEGGAELLAHAARIRAALAFPTGG